jgi:hypothetical protein
MTADVVFRWKLLCCFAALGEGGKASSGGPPPPMYSCMLGEGVHGPTPEGRRQEWRPAIAPAATYRAGLPAYNAAAAAPSSQGHQALT